MTTSRTGIGNAGTSGSDWDLTVRAPTPHTLPSVGGPAHTATLSDMPSPSQPPSSAPDTRTGLAELTTLRLGGPARRLVTATSEDELIDAVDRADRAGEPVLVLGGGSNVVVSDAGFDGTVVLVRTRGLVGETDSAGTVAEMEVAAGEVWDAFVARTIDMGCSGIEALSGIPGLVGATPIQNVGAYGHEVSRVITHVRTWDRRERAVHVHAGADCGFGYRSSMFKADPTRWVVLAVTFRLPVDARSAPIGYTELARHLGVAVGDRVPAAAARESVLALRRAKGMVLDPDDHDTWSAGSFFTNPILTPEQAATLPDDAPRFAADGMVKTSAAWLIERAGFGKGYGDGPARLSTKHTLAITNRGGARTADVIALAREVRDGVEARFGVRLVNEPVTVGCTI